MSFHNKVFPFAEAYGSQGGPQFRTAAMRQRSGGEERVSRWEYGHMRYDLTRPIESVSVLATLITWWQAHKGHAVGFLFFDKMDHATTADHRTPSYMGASAVNWSDQTIGVGDGVTTTFQLTKTYDAGDGFATQRVIRKPIASSVVVGVNSVEQTSGWTVDANTGELSFSVAPTTGHAIEWGGEYNVPVRFDKGAEEWLDLQHADYLVGGINSLPLVEDHENVKAYENWLNQGSRDYGSISADVQLEAGFGTLVLVNPSVSGLKVKLPSVASYDSDGGPIFVVFNEGATHAVQLTDSGGTSIGSPDSIAAGGSGEVWIGRSAAGARLFRLMT